MLKRFAGAVAVAAVLVTSPAVAGDLDKENVRAGLAKRLEEAFERQDSDLDVSKENIQIEKVVKVKEPPYGMEGDFYAVRAIFEDSEGEKRSNMDLIVSEDGENELLVRNLKTGESAFNESLSKIKENENVSKKENLPDDLGEVVYDGDGDSEVITFLSLTCGYCQKAFDFFKENKEQISNWKMVNIPNPRVDSTWTISLIMEDAENVDLFDLWNYAYNDMDEEKLRSTKEEMVKEFASEFPELKEQWGEESTEETVQRLEKQYGEELKEKMENVVKEYEVQATPRVYINDTEVRGWSPEKYQELL